MKIEIEKMGHGQKSGQKEVPPGGRKQCSAIKKAFAPCECTHDCIKNMCPAIADVRLRIDGSKGSAACKKMIRRLNQGMNSRTPSAKERRHITHTEGEKRPAPVLTSSILPDPCRLVIMIKVNLMKALTRRTAVYSG